MKEQKFFFHLMKGENFFYIAFFLTVLFMRLAVLLVPNIDLMLFGVVIHHFWMGVMLIALGLIIPKRTGSLRMLTTAVGFGLMIDELLFTILGSGGDMEYWALPSLISTIVIAVIVFFFRKKIKRLLFRKKNRKT